MSTSRIKHSRRHAAELQRWVDSLLLVPGIERRHVVDSDDLEIEVTLRVRRRSQPVEISTFRTVALEWLIREPWRVDHCDTYLKGRNGRRCTARIVAAVAYRSYWRSHPGGPEPAAPGWGALAFRFVCSRHRQDPGVDAREILATIELTPTFLAEPQRLWRQEQARRAKESREADEQRTRIEADLRKAHPDWSWDQLYDETEEHLRAWRNRMLAEDHTTPTSSAPPEDSPSTSNGGPEQQSQRQPS